MNVRRKNNRIGNHSTATRIIYILVIFALLTLMFAGCNQKEYPDEDTNTETIKDEVLDEVASDVYYSFTDANGNEVEFTEKPQRVVSLMGSYAETWILAGGDLIGVTEDAMTDRDLGLPADTQIIGTVKEPNLEEIIALSPDFVILSPDMSGHVDVAETFKQMDIVHAFFKVEHFEDYLNMLKICTDITGNSELYEKNGLEVKKQIDDILAKVPDIDEDDRSEVLFIRAFSSGAKAKSDDNMTCKILDDFKTVNIAAKHESLLEELSMEIIILEDPDYIFVVPMADTEKSLQALEDGIQKNPAWSTLSAVENNRYYVLPKELFHYKPNARWGESYEYIAKILYPEIFE
ncbi:MAG: ABC transporter substrate-binding protein [Ruminococcaceae bacterium]|nr:ABC transporter substrate-binding protein [Oscillospiraceae bacterium]